MVVIQIFIEDSADIFRAIRLEALRDNPTAFGASIEDEAAMPLSFFARRIADNAVFGGFAADGALDGVIGVRRSRSAKTRHIATIWGMYVRPRARGTGLSADLLAAAIADARTTSRSIRMSVEATNRAAHALYRRAGFVDWAVDRGALLVDGVFRDEILMRLDTA